MGKYDDAIGGGKIILDVEEVLNEEAARKVDDKIKQHKAELEKPIDINVKADKAEKRIEDLAKAVKQIKEDLQEAISSKKNFEEINKLVSKYELLKKQIKSATPEVDKNNTSLKESNQILKDTKKIVDQLTVSQDKLNKTRKTKKSDSTKTEAKNAKELVEATDDVIKAQEKVAKTKIRTQEQVNAELDKELKKLKEIEAQQDKNEAALERFKKKRANYGKEVFGTDNAIYDTDLLKGAAAELKEFNALLETRNKYQEKYNKLCRMVEKYYVSDYGVSGGVYKNLDQFVELNKDMKRLDKLFESGQKTTNKEINELFKGITRELQSEGSMILNLIASGEAIGDKIGQALDKEESELNRETQRLYEERQLQLSKINALRQEEMDLIKQTGQEQKKNADKLKFADGTVLNENQVKAVKKYCAMLKKSMGEAYNEARELKAALDLVFDIKEGNVDNLMDRFHSGNKASNAVLKIMTEMDVNNQKNRDAALRSLNPVAYDKIIAEQKAMTEKAKEELKAQKSDFEKQWDEFVSVMIGEDAFKDESNLAKGKILKAFGSYGKTAKEAIEEVNKAWLEGKLEGKSFKSKWVQQYVDHLDNLKERYDELRNIKAEDLDINSLFGLGGTKTLDEGKAQALRNEAAAWDELIVKKKEYYGIEQQDPIKVEFDTFIEQSKALSDSFGGDSNYAAKYLELIKQIESGTLSAADAFKQLNEFVTESSKKVVETQLKLTKKRNSMGKIVPQTYTAVDGKYLVEKGTVGWNVYDHTGDGYGELIATYETLNELRRDSALIAEQEAAKQKDTAKQMAETHKKEENIVQNIVQLVDNYGHELDETNNKLMQGVKLLNEQAQILRLFHNSPNIFDAFDATQGKPNQGQALGQGNYLGLHQNGEFNDLTYGRYQTQWYANVQNPFNVGDRLTDKQSAAIIDRFMADRAETFKQHMLSKLTDNDVVTAIKDIAEIAKTTVGEIFTSIGYDSIKDGAQINVFDSSKIHRANDSVLDIGAAEFEEFREIQKKIWEEQKIIENAKYQIKKLSNDYSGQTEDELDFALSIETLSKGFGWTDKVAKIASAFKELTGNLPKSDSISEESMRKLVENYEFSKQNLQAYQDAVVEHTAILSELTPKLHAQQSVIDNITQSYLSGDISGIVNPKSLDSMSISDKLLELERVTNKSVAAILSDYDQLDNEIKEKVNPILQSLGLMNDQFKLTFDKAIGGNSIAILSKDFVILQKFIESSVEFSDQLINKLNEAKQMGVNVAPILERTFSTFADKSKSGDGKFISGYEVQERATGNILHAEPKVSDLNKALEENKVILKSTDEQLIKFIQDWITLSRMGLQIDPSKGGNFLYSFENGFSFIDLTLQSATDKAEDLKTTFIEITSMLANTKGFYNLGKDDDLGLSSSKIIDRVANIFEQIGVATKDEVNNWTIERYDGIGNIRKELPSSVDTIKEENKLLEEQAKSASEVVKQTEAQIEAEKKASDEAKRFANNLSDLINGDGDDGAIKTIVEMADQTKTMIELISSAAGKSAATKFLEGITSETDLQSRVSGYFNEVFNGDDWKFKEGKGAWSVKGNTYTANLVNSAQDALKAVFKLDEGVLKLQEDLLELKGANIVDNFDVSAAIRQASADVRNLKADLGSIKYDGIGELEGLASSITSIEGVEKFKTALSAAKTEVAALKKEYAKGTNSLNDFSKASSVMRNAETSIKSMKMDLEALGNVDGVSQAEAALNRMTVAAQNFKKATSEAGQRDAWNSYNEAKIDYDAQYKYAQKTAKAQESQVGSVKNQYQTILDLVNKINTANERMIKFQSMDGGSGMLAGKIAQEQTKKLEAIEKLNSVMQNLNLSNVLGKDNYLVPDDIASIGTDYSQITAFINDAGVQASLSAAEIEKLVKSLEKASDIDLSMLSEVLNSSSIKERAAQVAKENAYFSDKTSVSLDADGNTKVRIEDIQNLGTAGTTAKEKLEELAQAIAKNSDGAIALTKNFSMGADGIARLDFSVFDTNTGSIKDFTAALGTATGQMGAFETTVDKVAKSKQTALSQIEKSQKILASFGFGDVGLKDANAPAQVANVLEKIQALSTALQPGNETFIDECIKDLVDATKEFEKAGNSALKMKNAIANGTATKVNAIDPKGDIYGQLVKEAQNVAAANGAATLEIGKFDEATNTLNYSLVNADGTVKQFRMSMYGLGGECAYQQTGVTKLASSWDKFKASIGRAGKQLMTALVGYNVFYKAISEVRKGIGYVKEIDLAMTELKKVTNETKESYDAFLDSAANRAGVIGSTVSDFTEAAANFARLGYTMDESANMAETAIVYKNVAD